MIRRRIEVVCDACGEPITDNTYCDGHKPGCTHYHDYDADVPCSCNIHYHTECCPVCNQLEDAAEDVAWREFIANEFANNKTWNHVKG